MRQFKFFRGYVGNLSVVDIESFVTASYFGNEFQIGPIERIGNEQFRIRIQRPTIVRVPTRGKRFEQFIDNKIGWSIIAIISAAMIIYSSYQILSYLIK